jgi:hypothetical protein
MAEQGARAACEHRRQLSSPRRDGRVAERVDAAVKAVETTVAQPARDRVVRDAQIAQLVDVNHAVLAAREIGHGPSHRGVWADFPAI